MPEIINSHQDLLSEIEATQTEPGKAAFWWLGQHTFVVKAGQIVLYIDPFFAAWESRNTPPLLNFEEGKLANYTLVTHTHGDHLCPETLSAMKDASPNCHFICPKSEVHRLVDEAGIPESRITSMRGDDVFTDETLKVTAIPAKHETFDFTEENGYPFLGYVIEINGVKIYHAGDTIFYDGMLARLQKLTPLDVAFLPINGRSAEQWSRNLMGNMTYQEAVEVAGELKVGLAVPTHYDMFIGNQEDPQKFVNYLKFRYPNTPAWVGGLGKQVLFG